VLIAGDAPFREKKIENFGLREFRRVAEAAVFGIVRRGNSSRPAGVYAARRPPSSRARSAISSLCSA
jgi:hypothetical protein